MTRSARAVGHILTAGAPQCALSRALTYSCRARGKTNCTVQCTLYSNLVHIEKEGTVINHHNFAFSTGSKQKILFSMSMQPFLKLLFESKLSIKLIYRHLGRSQKMEIRFRTVFLWKSLQWY